MRAKQRRRVLLIDDENDVRASTAAMLAELGYDVIQCDSADRAVEVLASGSGCDVILADVVMPGTSGLELSTLIRRWRPRTPIILITGKADGMAEAVEHGLIPLLKPFTSDQLEQVLAERVPAHS